MGLGKLLLVLSAIGLISAIIIQYLNPEIQIPPEFYKDRYWGKVDLKDDKALPKDSLEIKPFKVNVNQKVLDDLKSRLSNTRFIEHLPKTAFTYGFNSEYLKSVINYWMTKYDWRNVEKDMNLLPQYTTEIEGIQVHFLHFKVENKGNDAKVFPLIMVHGWPGSFTEFFKIAPMLTNKKNDDRIAFELVIPSIPGYGFSEAPHKKGFNIIHTARIFKKLMNRLGYQKFFYHGGDWGAAIGKSLANIYPEIVLGYHTTLVFQEKMGLCTFLKMMIGYYFPNLIYDQPLEDYKRVYTFMQKIYFLLRETGYMHIQATKPDTIGTVLNDSPAGLAAYILEKFSTWVNPNYVNKDDGGLLEKFTIDELLTNVMVYWVTNSISSSVRFYKENINFREDIDIAMKKTTPESVPVAVASCPNELAMGNYPRALIKDHFKNLVQFTNMPKGGHFAAFEEPEMIAQDIRNFVKKVIDRKKGSK